VHVVTLSDIDTQLAEIDENLIRNELNALERGEQLAKRKGLYEAKYPQTKQGGAPGKAGGGKTAKSADSASFAKDTAAKTKQSARTIAEDVQIANQITEPVRNSLRDTPTADSKSELLTIARLDAQTQTEVAEKISKGEAANVREALRGIAKDTPRQTSIRTSKRGTTQA
jgi:ParB family chromosome partitioning protein